jgi:hypothetical protein
VLFCCFTETSYGKEHEFHNIIISVPSICFDCTNGNPMSIELLRRVAGYRMADAVFNGGGTPFCCCRTWRIRISARQNDPWTEIASIQECRCLPLYMILQ